MLNFKDDRACVKCGYKFNHTYIYQGEILSTPISRYMPEHMKKKCGQCGYVWLEYCLDSEQNKKFNNMVESNESKTPQAPDEV